MKEKESIVSLFSLRGLYHCYICLGIAWICRFVHLKKNSFILRKRWIPVSSLVFTNRVLVVYIDRSSQHRPNERWSSFHPTTEFDQSNLFQDFTIRIFKSYKFLLLNYENTCKCKMKIKFITVTDCFRYLRSLWSLYYYKTWIRHELSTNSARTLEYGQFRCLYRVAEGRLLVNTETDQ